MKNRERKLALLLCIALSPAALGACGKTTVEETVAEAAVVETANPERGSLKLSGSFIATINPDESVYVIPKTTAEVLEVRVEAGDTVMEGDVLAILDDTMAQFTMRNAEAAAQNAQIGLENAQIGLESAQLGYDLQYGEAATALHDMNSDAALTQVEDGMTQLQKSYVDAMDALKKAKNKLKDAEQELADLKEEYDYREDVDEIKEYAETFAKGSPAYNAAMARYGTALEKETAVKIKINGNGAAVPGLKPTIDQLEENIEKIQDQIDSTYENYSRTAASQNLNDGVLREEQKQSSQNTISQAQLGISQAEAGISQAQISLDQAQENLEAYTITATISGVVESVNLKEHDFASSGSPAFIISNKDVMVATYYVSEDVRNTFSAGQKIKLEKDGVSYDGEVVEIGSAVDMNTGLFRIKAAVHGSSAGLLSGTKATVTTDTYHEDNAIIIPYDAVYYDGTQAYVYIVADGRAKKTNITTGLYDTGRIVVTEGLTVDDVVVTTWSAQLREGVEISVHKGNTEK